MPKRNRDESKEDRWRRKMKKYEEKLEGNRRSFRRIIYSDDEDDVYPQEHLGNELESPINYTLPAESECALRSQDLQNEVGDVIIRSPDAEAGVSLTHIDAVPPHIEAAPLHIDVAPPPPLDEIAESDNFDPQLLKALGDNESDIVEYGNDLQADLASRFQRILLCGLKKETKQEILKKYLFPKNVPLAKGPALNPEIGAMLVETCKLRDKRLLSKQDQLGKALSILGNAMTCLLKKTPDIPDIIRTLNDAGQLLADSHYTETDTRRSVIIPLIDKSLTDSFKDRKRDSLLFGENLGDLVKNSRGIKKTSQLIQAQNSSAKNGKGPSTRARYQHQRSGQMYAPRAGGPKPTTSYAYYAYPSRKRAPPPPMRNPPPPPPPARRPQPTPAPARAPRYTAPR